MLSTQRNLELPEKLKKYQMKGFIGNGTYGYVYQAIDGRNGQAVVIKIGSEQDIKTDYSSLKTEVQFLRWLRHENIIRLIDYSISSSYNTENRPLQHSALVLEDCVCDLKQVMFLSTMTVRTIKTVITQLLHGLEYLRQSHVIHCDVKPSNILLSSTGVLKICDFGLARPGGFYSRKPGFNKHFSPPETLLGAKILNYSVDAWSAGCILTELFKGSFLFLLKNDTINEHLKAIFELCGNCTEETWEALYSFCDKEKKKICTKDKPRILSLTLEEFVDDRLARDLICRLLVTDPRYRWASKQALMSPYLHCSPYTLPDLKHLVEMSPNLRSSEDHDSEFGNFLSDSQDPFSDDSSDEEI